jgi:hypothetical protein
MEEVRMPRPVVIALGVLLWGAFIVVTIERVRTGDGIAPLVAIVVVTTAVSGWHLGKRLARTLPGTEVES